MGHLNAAAEFIALLIILLVILAIVAGAIWWGYDTVKRMFDDWESSRYDFRTLDYGASDMNADAEHEVGPLPHR